MAGRILSKLPPSVGKILWGDKWSSTLASAAPPFTYRPHASYLKKDNMAGRIFNRLTPTIGKILWGEKWSSTLVSTAYLPYRPHRRLAEHGHLKQWFCSSYGKLMYGEKWIWRQTFYIPHTVNAVKNGLYQKKAEHHFRNLPGANPAALRDSVQGKVDEAQKYVKVVVDAGTMVANPLKVAAVAITSFLVIKAFVKEMKEPGSTIKTLDDMAASARKEIEDENDLPDSSVPSSVESPA